MKHQDHSHTPAKKDAPDTDFGLGTIYTCPMHPQVRQGVPGNCPICGMALEPEMPTEDEDDSELRRVRLMFWIALAFTLPVVGIAMLPHLFELSLSLATARPLRGAELLLSSPVVLWTALGYRVRLIEPGIGTVDRSAADQPHQRPERPKHVPLIHNVFNTNDVVGVSDAATDALLLAGHEIGRRYLVGRRGVSAQLVAELDHLGISSWANVIAAIKIARAYDLGPEQAVRRTARICTGASTRGSLRSASGGASMKSSRRRRSASSCWPRGRSIILT